MVETKEFIKQGQLRIKRIVSQKGHRGCKSSSGEKRSRIAISEREGPGQKTK